MALQINEYKKNINVIEKDYKKVCDMHQKYNSTLKKYSSEDIILINIESNITTKDLKKDFEEFERWYSRFFNQFKRRVDKYEKVIDDYDDVDDAYNYEDAVNDMVYLLIALINDHFMFTEPIRIDVNLIDIKEYMKCLDNLIEDYKKLIK